MTTSRNAMSPTLPLVVAEWQRGARETIRIVLDGDGIDVRAFYAGDAEEPLRRGRVGITLGLLHLKSLHLGVDRAYREAVARGLIDGADNG